MISKRIELEKDFYKNELLKMGYFKTPEGRQLYELSLTELEQIYEIEKRRLEFLKIDVEKDENVWF